jgi:hypothetical protein
MRRNEEEVERLEVLSWGFPSPLFSGACAVENGGFLSVDMDTLYFLTASFFSLLPFLY